MIQQVSLLVSQFWCLSWLSEFDQIVKKFWTQVFWPLMMEKNYKWI